jgi:hypothetical protein
MQKKDKKIRGNFMLEEKLFQLKLPKAKCFKRAKKLYI